MSGEKMALVEAVAGTCLLLEACGDGEHIELPRIAVEALIDGLRGGLAIHNDGLRIKQWLREQFGNDDLEYAAAQLRRFRITAQHGNPWGYVSFARDEKSGDTLAHIEPLPEGYCGICGERHGTKPITPHTYRDGTTGRVHTDCLANSDYAPVTSDRRQQ